MTIAVLGGAGYIGSHTVAQLVKAGQDVVVLDNLITGHKRAVDPKARFLSRRYPRLPLFESSVLQGKN